MPDAIPGLPMDRKTVSRVRSIFLRDLVKSSCFLILYVLGKDDRH